MTPFSVPNVRRFIAFRIFFNARFYYPVFAVLFLDLGVSLAEFALLNTVWAATIVVAEVPSGALADAVGRRFLVVAAAVLMVIELILLAAAPTGHHGWLMAVLTANRILSGLAEAAASGADEALAYDSLEQAGMAGQWDRVLERQMRLQSMAYVIAMIIGAAIYDADLVRTALAPMGLGSGISPDQTLRWPAYVSVAMGLGALAMAVRMQEPATDTNAEPVTAAACASTIRQAFALTWSTGRWILTTPFVLAILGFGLLYDHIVRLVFTLSSQYYRVIDIPESAFGIIGSCMALLGMILPSVARRMARRWSPAANMGVVALTTLIGLIGVAMLIPKAGAAAMGILVAGMVLSQFFVSDYLNRATASSRRATVLSFRGLVYNLAYGGIGMVYGLIVTRLPVPETTAAAQVADAQFALSAAGFPVYFVGATALITIAVWWRMEKADRRQAIASPDRH